MKELKAVIFDLDGVITNTAKYHYIAWKQISNELSIDINIEFNEQLKGIDRYNSMLRILEFGNKSLSDEQIEYYMDKKNKVYRELLSGLSAADILPGISELFGQLRESEVKIAIASASKNGPEILARLGLSSFVDFIAQPELITNPKPAPDIFLNAAEGVNCQVTEVVGIEDAIAGIEAIKAAGIKSVAIGLSDVGADLELKDTTQLRLNKIRDLLNS